MNGQGARVCSERGETRVSSEDQADIGAIGEPHERLVEVAVGVLQDEVAV